MDWTVASPIADDSSVGEARRATRRATTALEFPDLAAERAAILVTEAARNVLLHGGGGHVLLTPVERRLQRGLDIVAVDRGRGIEDVRQALRDGYSTAGTRGEGLGAIARLASSWDLYTQPGAGTALVARIWPGEVPGGDGLEVGAICVPAPGEHVSGDRWAVVTHGGRIRAMVVDGLGHGPAAAQAAEAAVAAFRSAGEHGPERLLEIAHDALRPTRGAAMAVAVEQGDGSLKYAGVGNIAGVVLSAGQGVRNMVSSSGTLGHEVRRMRSYDYAWPAGAHLVLHSDGLQSRWSLDAYPGLFHRAPALLAAVLWRDQRRGRDDATVLVLRRGGEP